MSSNVSDIGNTIISVKSVRFNSLQELYEDLLSNQSFIKSEDKYNGDDAIIEGHTIYRHVKLKRGILRFFSNKFGGSELVIRGKLSSIERVHNIDLSMSEYRLGFEGCDKPFIFLAFKKS